MKKKNEFAKKRRLLKARRGSLKPANLLFYANAWRHLRGKKYLARLFLKL